MITFKAATKRNDVVCETDSMDRESTKEGMSGRGRDRECMEKGVKGGGDSARVSENEDVEMTS